MKELVFKRQNELEEIYRGVHMDVDCDGARQILSSLIDSGFKNSLFLGLFCILLTIIFLILFVVPALEIMVVVDMS